MTTAAWTIIALLAAQTAGQPAATPPAPPHVAVPVDPDETFIHALRTPSANDMARVYPRAALRAGVAGTVVLKCRMAAVGGLEACSVISETPEGMGFGEAALKLASVFAYPTATPDGVSVVGKSKHLRIAFKLQ